jgi:hypothetical protein
VVEASAAKDDSNGSPLAMTADQDLGPVRIVIAYYGESERS